MKKLIVLFILIGLLLIGFFNQKALAAETDKLLSFYPCDRPKTFSIGSIDPRFHITKSALLQDAITAGNVWGNNKGMSLMQYDPNATMQINMVYDQRQSLNTQINTINNQVSEQKNELKPQIAEYKQKEAAFKKQSDDLNAQILFWNSKGGAPPDVYKQLIGEQQSLQQQATVLQQMADKLNQSTDQYNQQINQLNQKVDNYNNALVYKPEEGEYIIDGANKRIDIYFNNSQAELIHTLEHEMGHAIGLDHNSNPNSIMYPQTNQASTPSIDDENALTIVCKKRSVFEIASEYVSFVIATINQDIHTISQ